MFGKSVFWHRLHWTELDLWLIDWLIDWLKSGRSVWLKWNFCPTWRSHTWTNYVPAGSLGQKVPERKERKINIYWARAQSLGTFPVSRVLLTIFMILVKYGQGEQVTYWSNSDRSVADNPDFGKTKTWAFFTVFETRLPGGHFSLCPSLEKEQRRRRWIKVKQ